MTSSEINSQSLQRAELRSECIRINSLLAVLGALLVVVLVRGVMSLAEGHSGEAWPFALLLATIASYEVLWRRFVEQATRSDIGVSRTQWAVNVFIESLLPTVALFLQIHTSFIGPHRTLTSPSVFVYFLFIILSTLHLDAGLSRLAGAFSAAGYVLASIYVLVVFPEPASSGNLLSYGILFSTSACLLLGGFAAGAVAGQIRLHVVAALSDAENRAKIAQLEHDLSIARSIQQGLLPKTPPQVDGFEIAGWNKPADETGGDYFDWQELSGGRLAVTIADVTGHGIGPALVTAACRAYVRAGFAAEPDLPHILDHVNRLLYEDLPSERFVTLAAGLLDSAKASLQLISAGHGPLLFYSSGEKCFRTYDAQGLPLGLMPQVKYGCPQNLEFAPGDILVLVTDGFIEWANAHDEDFGEDRLKQVVSASCDKPAAAIISELYSQIVKFAEGTQQADDLTALVVKRL